MGSGKRYRNQVMGQINASNSSLKKSLETVKAPRDRMSTRNLVSSPRVRTVAFRFGGRYSFRLERLRESDEGVESLQDISYRKELQQDEKKIIEVSKHSLPSAGYPPQENKHVNRICKILNDDGIYEDPWLKCQHCESWQKPPCVRFERSEAARSAFICENCLALPVRWTAINDDALSSLDISKGLSVALSLPRKYLKEPAPNCEPVVPRSIPFYSTLSRSRSSNTFLGDLGLRMLEGHVTSKRFGQEFPVVRCSRRVLFRAPKQPMREKWRKKVKMNSLKISNIGDSVKRLIVGLANKDSNVEAKQLSSYKEEIKICMVMEFV